MAESVGADRTSDRVHPSIGDIAACLGFTLMAMLQGFAATQAVRDSDWTAATHYGVVAAALGICGFLTLLRGVARESRKGWRTRAIAVIGNFAIIPLAALPLTWRPDWLMTITTLAIVVLYCWVVWALLTLRRGFSVFPEARVLVTRGPYAIVRHPLYAAYLLVYAFVALPRLSVAAALIAALGIAAEVMRARNEEQVLGSVFPSYRGYAVRVPGFIPGVRRGRESDAVLKREADERVDHETGSLAA